MYIKEKPQTEVWGFFKWHCHLNLESVKNDITPKNLGQHVDDAFFALVGFAKERGESLSPTGKERELGQADLALNGHDGRAEGVSHRKVARVTPRAVVCRRGSVVFEVEDGGDGNGYHPASAIIACGANLDGDGCYVVLVGRIH